MRVKFVYLNVDTKHYTKAQRKKISQIVDQCFISMKLSQQYVERVVFTDCPRKLCDRNYPHVQVSEMRGEGSTLPINDNQYAIVLNQRILLDDIWEHFLYHELYHVQDNVNLRDELSQLKKEEYYTFLFLTEFRAEYMAQIAFGIEVDSGYVFKELSDRFDQWLKEVKEFKASNYVSLTPEIKKTINDLALKTNILQKDIFYIFAILSAIKLADTRTPETRIDLLNSIIVSPVLKDLLIPLQENVNQYRKSTLESFVSELKGTAHLTSIYMESHYRGKA